MAPVVCLDTHALVALFIGDTKKIGREALRLLHKRSAVITPAVILELQLLFEVGRLNFDALHIFTQVNKSVGVTVDEPAWEPLYQQINRQSWTRDPFDRTIVGHAAFHKAALISKDELIQANYAKAIW